MIPKRLLGYFLTVIIVGSCLMASMAFAAKKVIVLPLDEQMYVVPFSNSVVIPPPPPPGVPTVTSAGQTWMDRNLGASQVATSYDNSAGYGDLYQWGRLADGHEKRISETTSFLSSSDTPGHGNFILSPSLPNDWRFSKNNELWQGESGINNPCPSGFRLPTETELEAERASWSSRNSAGAFASPLKLVSAGYRYPNNGTVYDAGSRGSYWSSTVNGFDSLHLDFFSGTANMYHGHRANGHSVRCIMD